MLNKFKKAITFSFDDGVIQDRKMISLLNKYGLKATFNLNSGKFSETGTMPFDGRNICNDKVSADEVKELYKGHEVAVHTLTHPILPKLSDEEIIYQIETDRENLEKLVGYEICGMAYPGNGKDKSFDERVFKLIREKTNIKYARTTTDVDSFDPQEDLIAFNPNMHYFWNRDRMYEMADRFFNTESEKPQVFYIWGHSYELDLLDNVDLWAELEEFFKYISGRDGVFYGTNAEVLL